MKVHITKYLFLSGIVITCARPVKMIPKIIRLDLIIQKGCPASYFHILQDCSQVKQCE